MRDWLALLSGRSKPEFTCRTVTEGSAIGGDILCIFSSFDTHNNVPDYVLTYLKELRRQGCDIIFVTTSRELTDVAIQKLSPICSRIVHRKNCGLDFASWKLGMSLHPSSHQYHGILLVNDSMLGPLRSLDDEFSKLRRETDQVVGMTDSSEVAAHLQSYFLYFPNSVFQSRVFQNFWEQIAVLRDKDQIIRSYEIGLSQHLLRMNIGFYSLFPTSKLQASAEAKGDEFEFRERMENGKSLNPTLHFWEILCNDFDFPFVKRGTLLDHPELQGTHGYLSELRVSTTPIKQEISQYLEGKLRHAK